MDRLNQLPDDIIVNILSRLPTEDAARTRVLSKQWTDYWTQVNTVELSYPNNNMLKCKNPTYNQSLQTSKRFIDKLLLEPSNTINKLSFNCLEGICSLDCTENCAMNCFEYMNKWLEAALSRGVTNLYINSNLFLFPSHIKTIFTAKNLRILHLGNFYNLSINNLPKFNLPYLTFLSMEIQHPYSNTIEQLFCPDNFPALQILHLKINFLNCGKLIYCLRITSPTLNELKLVVQNYNVFNQRVVLDTPVLHQFTLLADFDHLCLHSNAMPELIMLSTNTCFSYQIPFKKDYPLGPLYSFSSIENLVLNIHPTRCILSGLYYLKYLPRLTKLVVNLDKCLNNKNISSYNDRKCKIRTTLPHLKEVELCKFSGSDKEMDLLGIISSHATSITKLIIRFEVELDKREMKCIRRKIHELPWKFEGESGIIFM